MWTLLATTSPALSGSWFQDTLSGLCHRLFVLVRCEQIHDMSVCVSGAWETESGMEIYVGELYP